MKFEVFLRPGVQPLHQQPDSQLHPRAADFRNKLSWSKNQMHLEKLLDCIPKNSEAVWWTKKNKLNSVTL